MWPLAINLEGSISDDQSPVRGRQESINGGPGLPDSVVPKGAVTYHRIALTNAERTEKCKTCLSGGESGGNEGRRGRCKERIKRMGNA